MKNLIILYFFYNVIKTTAFDCPNPTGTYTNPNDYQSYYVCNKNCSYLQNCQSPNPYFLSNNKSCSSKPDNWIPRYYLTGVRDWMDQYNTTYTTYVVQDGYKLLWSSRDSVSTDTFTGQYVNETYVQGIIVRRVFATSCINVLNVEVLASADRAYCITYALHPQSDLCDLTFPNRYTFCLTLSF